MTKTPKIPAGETLSGSRCAFIDGVGAVGGAAILGAPHIRKAGAADTTSWPGGIGLEIFKDWCNGIVEKTDGELALQPFGAKDVVGDFQLFDAVKNGVIEAMNPFTLYWAGRMSATVFLSSYLLGLRPARMGRVLLFPRRPRRRAGRSSGAGVCRGFASRWSGD